MENIKQEWFNGFRIIWRMFLLFFFVGGIYQIGKAIALLTAEFIGPELVTNCFLGIYGLLCIVLFPLIVSYVSEAISLKANTVDLPLTRQMKERREPVDADNQITRP